MKEKKFVTVREYVTPQTNELSSKVFKLANIKAKADVLAFVDALEIEGVFVSEVAFDFPNLLAIVKFAGGYDNANAVSELYIKLYENGCE